MATSKWKQVKVKVKGKMVTRWTDGKTFRLSKPGLKSGLRQAATSGLKKGDYNVGRTKQWDGKKYVPVNVTRAGQKATLNGKPVVADGKGNWRTPAPNSISGYGKKVGTYKPGNRTSGSNTPTPRKRGVSNIPPKEAQPGSPSYVKPKSTGGSGSGNRKNVTPTTPKRKPQAEVGSKNPSKAAKDSNMKAWAKANPDLAKKVKKGQAGYEAIQSVINPNAKAKPANIGPVKDGAKYARSLAKPANIGPVKDGAKYARSLAKPANVGPVKDGAKYARSLAKSNEKKKKQRRFSNESLRRAGQRTYNRGAA